MSFDVLAPWYRTLEWIALGDHLQRCRVAGLGKIAPPRALVVGEGNGRFLCELLRLHPEVEVDCLDASQRMLDFCVPPNGMARPCARGWLAAMYLFFRVTARNPARELIDPAPCTRAEGFALARLHSFRKGMLKSEIWRRNV